MYDDGYGEDGYGSSYRHGDEHGMEQNEVPDVVRNFIVFFRNVINEGQLYEIQNSYDTAYPKITEHFYSNSPWPAHTEISKYVEGDEVFLSLYQELYYRHIYANIPGGPTMNQQLSSYFNYCTLFNYILSAQQPVSLELPDQWLWELLDEFVYQFQLFTQYRSNLKNLTEDDLENVVAHSKAWNVLCVLNVLHFLVDKSNIKTQLEVYASGGDPDSVAGEFGHHSLYKMLGYFSLVGLLRLHSLHGDYYQAIKVLEYIELNKKSQYSHVPACQVSMSYYVGFAYMMMRRYADAIRTFSSILLYVQRTKQLFSTRSYQNDQINKQTEQMYHLLAICLALHPQCIDESIQQILHEKNYTEKMYKMQCGDLSEFQQCFMFACPKFLSPSPPPLDGPRGDFTRDAVQQQLKVFMDEVEQQKRLPTIRSYLKLYTTLPLSKLTTFMSLDDYNRSDNRDRDRDRERENRDRERERERDVPKETMKLTIDLLCFKHKMKNIVWTKGTSGLDGKFQSGSELDFYIDNNMIHIADTKVADRDGDFFIRKILKFDELNRKLHGTKI